MTLIRHCVLLILVINVGLLSCYQEEEIPVAIDFEFEVVEESYTVPVQLKLLNRTTGADFYSWIFEGASPGVSDKKQPGAVSYSQAGTYRITLEAWNDTQRHTKEITLQLDSAVTIGFDADIVVNDFVPATVHITNKTRGASTYAWTFEGGAPESSALADPPAVHYTAPGEYTIKLVVTNGRETFTTLKTIVLRPAMVAGFEIIPAFEDEDYEAPLIATLQNNTVSGLRYTWSSDGGSIVNTTDENTEIYFETAGEYTVTLNAENDKEIQTIQRTITVKPNRNLYTMQDVKLGINAAHATIGSFYSAKLRKTLPKDAVNNENGRLIDIVFFSINSSFSYCRFISPDSASYFTFPAIPGATQTSFVNTLETSALSFSETEFDAMVDDAPLRDLDIKGNDTESAFFDNTQVPRIILFETADGRKGAIKVKSFVGDGGQSYILADIKVQK